MESEFGLEGTLKILLCQLPAIDWMPPTRRCLGPGKKGRNAIWGFPALITLSSNWEEEEYSPRGIRDRRASAGAAPAFSPHLGRAVLGELTPTQPNPRALEKPGFFLLVHAAGELQHQWHCQQVSPPWLWGTQGRWQVIEPWGCTVDMWLVLATKWEAWPSEWCDKTISSRLQEPSLLLQHTVGCSSAL